jgi:hypothetical protein
VAALFSIGASPAKVVDVQAFAAMGQPLRIRRDPRLGGGKKKKGGKEERRNGEKKKKGEKEKRGN